MSDWKIYHNPKCTKSRQTLELLRVRGIEPDIVEYLSNPPTKESLRALMKMLDGPARTLVRVKDDLYRELQFDLDSDATIAENLARHPELLERPIVVHAGQAVIGRPPENIEVLFR